MSNSKSLLMMLVLIFPAYRDLLNLVLPFYLHLPVIFLAYREVLKIMKIQIFPKFCKKNVKTVVAVISNPFSQIFWKSGRLQNVKPIFAGNIDNHGNADFSLLI